eukprot:754002-Hanusia_phi.AAC.1
MSRRAFRSSVLSHASPSPDHRESRWLSAVLLTVERRGYGGSSGRCNGSYFLHGGPDRTWVRSCDPAA